MSIEGDISLAEIAVYKKIFSNYPGIIELRANQTPDGKELILTHNSLVHHLRNVLQNYSFWVKSKPASRIPRVANRLEQAIAIFNFILDDKQINFEGNDKQILHWIKQSYQNAVRFHKEPLKFWRTLESTKPVIEDLPWKL